MSVPMKRHASSAKGRRRSHHALKKVNLNKCSQCGRAIKAHQTCSFCGSYKGKKVIKVKTDKVKKKKEGR